MNDDLTWLGDNTASKDNVPSVIWYLQGAHPSTCEELLRKIPDLKQLVAQAFVVINAPRQFLNIEPEVTPEIYDEITRDNQARQYPFRQFIDERVTEDEEYELAERSQLLLFDIYDVAPYDHLVVRGMRPEWAEALTELTLDDVGLENREVYGDQKDARSIMRYMSVFPKQPRDHAAEWRELRWDILVDDSSFTVHPKYITVHDVFQRVLDIFHRLSDETVFLASHDLYNQTKLMLLLG
ncbi:hypothetical protein FLONG3_7042 [Fusarium longipes]|uniref:Uncharacterized protein n=1 Tax=Fusarium longipes TaxID=694270 RepID=A0A395SH74_9HYPO|nr:hypothetical protein FLONG3_7042 [Fusarium longipes]